MIPPLCWVIFNISRVMTAISISRVYHYSKELVSEMSNLILYWIKLLLAYMGLDFLFNLFSDLLAFLFSLLVVNNLIVFLFGRLFLRFSLLSIRLSGFFIIAVLIILFTLEAKFRLNDTILRIALAKSRSSSCCNNNILIEIHWPTFDLINWSSSGISKEVRIQIHLIKFRPFLRLSLLSFADLGIRLESCLPLPSL